MTLGKGRAEAIQDADIAALADQLKCHPADLMGIAEVESSGFGWFKDGRIKILFEKHWFYKFVSGAARAKAVRQGLARKKWVSPSRGGYSDQKGASSRYSLLERAMKVNREGALKSISIGRFQIMGFNHKICGFDSAEEMWTAFLDSEKHQLRAFANFLKSKGLVTALRKRDFNSVEKKYNGGGLGGAYARRMKTASDKLRRGKWANYRPGSIKPPVEPTPVPIPVPRPEGPAAPASTTPSPRPVQEAPEPGFLAAVLALIAGLFTRGRPNWTPDQDGE